MNFLASRFLPSSLPTLTHLLSTYSLQGAGLASVYIKMKKEDLSPLKEFCHGEVKISYTMAYIHLLLTDPCYRSYRKRFSKLQESSFSLLNKNLGLILRSSLVREKGEKRTKKKHLIAHRYLATSSCEAPDQILRSIKTESKMIFLRDFNIYPVLVRVPLALRNSIPN